LEEETEEEEEEEVATPALVGRGALVHANA
jgi:hypothetical protein